MQDTRTYAALTGVGEAFGWGKRSVDGTLTAAFGGLLPGEEYTLAGEKTFFADAQGGWFGRMQGEIPLYVAHSPDGKLALYDEERISRSDAALRARPKVERKAEIQPVLQQAAKVSNEKTPVTYRTRLGGASVDDLPALIWPEGTRNVQPYFAKGKPQRVLLSRAWRFVQLEGMERACYVGYRAADDRVCEVAWAVEAKGALMPPKGLAGYRYTRCADGKACWLLTKEV